MVVVRVSKAAVKNNKVTNFRFASIHEATKFGEMFAEYGFRVCQRDGLIGINTNKREAELDELVKLLEGEFYKFKKSAKSEQEIAVGGLQAAKISITDNEIWPRKLHETISIGLKDISANLAVDIIDGFTDTWMRTQGLDFTCKDDVGREFPVRGIILRNAKDAFDLTLSGSKDALLQVVESLYERNFFKNVRDYKNVAGVIEGFVVNRTRKTELEPLSACKIETLAFRIPAAAPEVVGSVRKLTKDVSTQLV